jgi:isocitrate/isopropylmalate dehydrogenase
VQAIEALLADAHAPRTPDLGGSAGTADVGRAIAEMIARSVEQQAASG